MPTIKPESKMYRRLAEGLSGADPSCHLSRIESRVNLGFPDLVAAFGGPDGVFVPIELKIVRRGLLVDLRPHQIAFHAKHADLGCPTFILVEYHPPQTRLDAYAEWLLYAGEQAIELARLGCRLEPLARWPATRVQWHVLRGVLTGRDVVG